MKSSHFTFMRKCSHSPQLNTATFAFTLPAELVTLAVLRLLGTISELKKFELVGRLVIFAFSTNIRQHLEHLEPTASASS